MKNLLITVTILFPVVCSSALFNVNTTNDLIDVNPGDGLCEASLGGGNCTLRAAVLESNASPGADTINLPEGLYFLSMTGTDDLGFVGDLDITEAVTIQGEGMGSSIIDGMGVDRIFHLLSSTASLALLDMSITNGFEIFGGAIVAQNDLSIRRVEFDQNSANAGGAIYSTAGLTLIEESVFTANSTQDLGVTNQNGSAIFCIACSLLKIDSSTFSLNEMSSVIEVHNMSLEILNSTISNNLARAVLTQNANAIIRQSTIIDNTLGNLSHFSFDNSKFMMIGASILQNAVHSNCISSMLPLSLGYNLSDDATCSFSMTGDLENADADLGPLQNNGGQTSTHLPNPLSIAIGQIPSMSCLDNDGAPLLRDQRESARPDGLNCDLGSVEINLNRVFQNGFE